MSVPHHKPDCHLETMAVARGRDSSPGAPLNIPPTFASTYRDGGPIGYGRWGNPTWTAFEDTVGALEGGSAVAFSSGQAAIASLLAVLEVGALVVYPHDAYLGTRGLLQSLEQAGQIQLQPVDVTNTQAVIDTLDEASLIWLESPTNPLLGIAELTEILPTARRRGVRTVVDNTFATPLCQRPLTWGADAVVHSATKYLGGHSDLLLGVIVVNDENDREPNERDLLRTHRTLHGAIPGVMDAYLALRGLRTLGVRFARQQATAALMAERLADHPRVRRVRYPGLADDPFHDRARRQMAGFGAIVSFELADADAADAVTARLQLIVGGTSLGGVETMIDRRNRWPGEEAVPGGLLRLSLGLEHPEDVWADLAASLDQI
ncbi:MAG TPA: PLP-dependent transferase [Solirubrobacteraceae bacterium]